MTAMSTERTTSALARAGARALSLAAICAVLGASGCATSHPGPIPAAELAEAQTFPYFRTYWVGPSFDGHALAAADGLRGYIDRIGDSVYYGDCVQSKGIFGGGSCLLPLQVTTVIYRLHSNSPLGAQQNMLIRGVPATVYDEGRSIELYTGRVAVDVFSDTFTHALHAAQALTALNAPSSATATLPPPIYCPGISGYKSPAVERVLLHLPGRPCQRAAAALAYAAQLEG
jgi:hypothetical protein